MKNGRFLAKEEKFASVLSKIGNICSVVSISAIALVAISAILVKFFEIEHVILLFIAFLGPGIATVFGTVSFASTIYGWFRYIVLRKKVDKKGEALNEAGNQFGDFLSNLPDMLGQFFSMVLSQAGSIALVASVAASAITYVPAINEALNYNVRPPQIDNIISEIRSIFGAEEEVGEGYSIKDDVDDTDGNVIEIEQIIELPPEEIYEEEIPEAPRIIRNIVPEALPPPEEIFTLFTITGQVDLRANNLIGEIVSIELLSEDDRIVSRTRSDGYGNYVFMHVPEGDYRIRVRHDWFENAYGETFTLNRNMPHQHGVVSLAAFDWAPISIFMADTEPTVVEEPIILAEAETEHEPAAPIRLVARGGRSLMYSVRPELLIGSASAGVGGSVGLGMIGRGGFYFSMDLRYGPNRALGSNFYGGDFNFGWMFNRDGLFKNVLGLSVGYQYMSSVMNIKDFGLVISEREEDNYGFGGVFWKVLLGRRGNLDITNRLLFGHRISGIYTESMLHPPYRIERETKLNMTYSLGIGWTWIRNRSAVRIVDTANASPRRNPNRNARRNARIKALIIDTGAGAVSDATRVDTTRIEAVADTPRRSARRSSRREARRN
ncbi:MAG: carboxypeptidase-like regulatory domain-containing protein [Chitinivibrionia bacterium]|nr:carboxypeptidase-like regulatory domain-containing protein [Chitinivibrionia bacterium]